jgi:hypothetical protein
MPPHSTPPTVDELQAQIDYLATQVQQLSDSMNAMLHAQAATGTTPTLLSLDPASAVVGGAQFTLTVTGVNFAAGSVVVFNNADLPTNVVNDTTLKCTIDPGSWLPQTVPVKARVGDQETNALDFTFSAATVTAKNKRKR